MSIKKSALILIDLQNDFCAGGTLAVPEGEGIIPIANRLQPHFDLVVASKDWHPKNHKSFASNHGLEIGEVIELNGTPQVLWPDHCVQNSKGAEFHPHLKTNLIQHIVYKGIDPEVDSYSAFFDNQKRRSTDLEHYLYEQGVSDVYIMGLATDYCVKYSCLDAASMKFNVYCIIDGCRGVELNKGDIEKAIDEIKSCGVRVIQSKELL